MTHKWIVDEGDQLRAISLVVRIAAFQAVDPGSNPGWRISFCSLSHTVGLMVCDVSGLGAV